jgi:hypothetical protein
MRKISSLILLLLIYLVVAGCEIEKDNSLDQEMQKGNGQEPKTNLENQSAQPELKPLTNLTPEQKKLRLEAFGVVKENLEATQAEDTGRVVRTIHEDSPQLRSTREGMLFVFVNYDMAYQLEDMQLLAATYDEVKVLFKQTTKALKGTGFMNTRSIGVHTLKRSKDGNLKIFRSDFIKTEQI